MAEIIEKFDRKALSEGRSYGMGFAFLNKLSDNKFEALHAFTACKDYLNDFTYIETTGKPLNKIYGFKHEYTGVLKDQQFCYLGVRPVHYKTGSVYKKFDEIKSALLENCFNIVELLNKLEEKFKLEDRTSIECIEDITVIFKVPVFWTKFNFLISLYTLYIRAFVNITNKELKLPLEKIVARSKFIIFEDEPLVRASEKWLTESYFNKLLDYEYPEEVTADQIHNNGISGRISQLYRESVKAS